jgi:hypothetical protein
MEGACGKQDKCMHGFGGELEGKRRRGRPVRGLEGNINVDLTRNECELD